MRVLNHFLLIPRPRQGRPLPIPPRVSAQARRPWANVHVAIGDESATHLPSIPHKLLVPRHPMLLQQGAVFVLKRYFLSVMVLLLIGDIVRDGIHI